ncbi:helix-turn-helix domain-containing protein [Hoeflea sp. TYP-13]|uniref:AraC family transcriptional regulator n=1 Tax=Hoeflea sp. TYP-13 TaxID=3230023 RepID=UPI0034C6D27E
MSFEFVEFQPPPALRQLLRSSFFARGQIPYRFDKILPNGLAVAIFTLGEPHRLGKSPDADTNPLFDHSWLHGIQTSPVYNMPLGETHVLGLLFEPLGLHALFGLDMRLLKDVTVDARLHLPQDFVSGLEALYPDASAGSAHNALHKRLAGRLSANTPDWLMRFCDRIVSSRGALRMDEAYLQTGRSARYVNQRFKTAVGVSPKVLGRICRLQALLEAIEPAHPIAWTELAHRFGFFDQPHFNREFRTFSGLSPRRYSAERSRQWPDIAKGENVSFVPND